MRTTARGAPVPCVRSSRRTISLIDEVEITADEAPSDAILRVARASDADIVAVGSHETSGRTLRELVLKARRSVLAVPLGPARRRGSRPAPAPPLPR